MGGWVGYGMVEEEAVRTSYFSGRTIHPPTHPPTYLPERSIKTAQRGLATLPSPPRVEERVERSSLLEARLASEERRTDQKLTAKASWVEKWVGRWMDGLVR